MNKYTQIHFLLCILLLSAIAGIWLISPLFRSNAWDGMFQQMDSDSLLFARHLEQSLLKGKVATVDNYGAFPYEIETRFAPFYMNFLVGFVNVFFYFFPEAEAEPMYVAGCLPLIIAWFTMLMIVWGIYRISDRNKVLTLLCAFGMLPGYSASMLAEFMKLDYDHVISFYIWAWLICCAVYLKTKNHVYAYIGAVIVALFLSTWTGAPFFYGFATAYGIVLWLMNPEESSTYNSFAFVTMLIGGIVAIIFIPHSEATFNNLLRINTNVYHYGYLQGCIVLLGAFVLFSLNMLNRFSKPRLIGISIFFFVAVTLFVAFYDFFMQAGGILFCVDPIHATISELKSGFEYDDIFGKALIHGLYRFGPATLILPVLFILGFPKSETKEINFLRHWLILFFCLIIYQVRYVRWIGCGYGVIIGLSLYCIWRILNTYIVNEHSSRIRVITAMLPLMILILTVNYTIISEMNKFSEPEVEFLDWIKCFTPETSGYGDENTPEYGILSYWDVGNKISFYTKRPVVVSNSMWGYRTMADVFSATNENEAYELCNKYRIRYIHSELGRETEDNILNYWPILKKTPEGPEYKMYYQKVPSVENHDYFYFWLNNKLGMTKLGEFGTSSHFRAVFANESFNNVAPKNMLFECVKGAEFAMNIGNGASMSLSLEIKISHLNFLYKRELAADENGDLMIWLPYSNSYENGNIKTDTFYKVAIIDASGEKRLAELRISEEDVITGKKINLEQQLNYLSTF